MKPGVLSNGVAHFFMLLFIYTGWAKLMEMDSFRRELTASPVFGSIAGPIAWVVAITEILLVIALIVPAWRVKGLYASLIVMSLFTVYILGIWFTGDRPSCSCGGILEDLPPGQHLFFNLACITLAGIGIRAVRPQAFPPGSRIRWGNASFALLLLLSIAWILLTAAMTPAVAKTRFVGPALPSFELLLPDSLTRLNTADIPAGKPFIVIGFSPYCPNCKQEIMDITQNIRELHGIHIYLITVFPVTDLREFSMQYHLEKYPTITAAVDSKNTFLSFFNWHRIPYTVIFDARKRLTLAISGSADVALLSRYIPH